MTHISWLVFSYRYLAHDVKQHSACAAWRLVATSGKQRMLLLHVAIFNLHLRAEFFFPFCTLPGTVWQGQVHLLASPYWPTHQASAGVDLPSPCNNHQFMFTLAVPARAVQRSAAGVDTAWPPSHYAATLRNGRRMVHVGGA